MVTFGRPSQTLGLMEFDGQHWAPGDRGSARLAASAVRAVPDMHSVTAPKWPFQTHTDGVIDVVAMEPL